MLTQQFLAAVRGLLVDLKEHHIAQEVLDRIAKEYANIAPEHDQLLIADPSQLGQQRANAITKINSAASVIAATDFGAFYRNLDGIQSVVDSFLRRVRLAPFPTLDRVKTGIAEFRQLFQAFLARKHQPEDTFRVVVAAIAISELLRGIQDSFEVVARELEYQPPAGAETVTLVYDATPDLRELLDLLDALLSIWREISRELGIEFEPPTVARLETGSVIAIIVGSPLAVAVLTLFVTQWGRIKTFLDPVGSAATALKATVDLTTLSDFL